MISTDKQQLFAWAAAEYGDVFNQDNASCIGWVDSTGVRCVVAYNHYQHPAIDAHILSDKSRSWMTRRFLHVMFDYPFNQLKCSRITAPVRASNFHARRFVERLGFTIEGVLRKFYETGEDRVLYGMTREECRYA